MYSLKQIAQITNSDFFGKTDYPVSLFLNDSRALQSATDTLFIALKTGRNDGHQYIDNLAGRGVKSFLVSVDFDRSAVQHPDVSFVVSADPLKALQDLAAHHRRKFSIPVIGITGSNGKTVVKEWLYQLLKQAYAICRSPKSYNSQIGVPLSVLNLNDTHTLAIFEAGISKPGEMQKLRAIIQPTMGVLTSIGSAHDEGFESREQKIAEKLKLFSECEKVVIHGLDKKDLSPELLKKTLVVSDHEGADLKVETQGEQLKLMYLSEIHSLRIPFSDAASIYNASTCAAVLLLLGRRLPEITKKLEQLQPVALRLEIKNGIQNSLLINDYYNSDLDSVKIALSYLQQQNRRARKIVIVSDIEQSGISPAILYRQLADLFQLNKVDLVVGIGQEISRHKPLFKANSLFFQDTQNFISQFRSISYQFSDASILLKGARSFGFENISRVLQLKSHDTVFEVNLNRLTDNVNYYRSLLNRDVQLMCMVKAMGYGSGSTDIAKTLQHIGVNYLAVAYADEGVELKQAQINLPVMVMNPEEDAFDDMISYGLEPELYSFNVLHAFARRLDGMGIAEPYPVHIKIDTGMHRLGFEEKDLDQLCAELKQLPGLRVKTIFSHLSASDNPAFDNFTRQQMRVFEKAAARLEQALGYTTIKHLCNSAGITRFKEAHYNMVRLGIGMYGIGANPAEQSCLENVGVLKTRISQIKEVDKGETVSYNRSGKIEKKTRIATLPIGYADGFSRLLGNGRHGVYIRGAFCKTVGNICMDMCMVDITGATCSEGDEVIIFENAGQIQLMAEALQSISYEVLTNVSARVKRIYVQE
jgi:alanine racemase